MLILVSSWWLWFELIWFFTIWFTFDVCFFFFLSDHADKYGYGVVQQFVGHGVGRVFHADPVILHFSNKLKLWTFVNIPCQFHFNSILATNLCWKSIFILLLIRNIEISMCPLILEMIITNILFNFKNYKH